MSCCSWRKGDIVPVQSFRDALPLRGSENHSPVVLSEATSVSSAMKEKNRSESKHDFARGDIYDGVQPQEKRGKGEPGYWTRVIAEDPTSFLLPVNENHTETCVDGSMRDATAPSLSQAFAEVAGVFKRLGNSSLQAVAVIQFQNALYGAQIGRKGSFLFDISSGQEIDVRFDSAGSKQQKGVWFSEDKESDLAARLPHVVVDEPNSAHESQSEGDDLFTAQLGSISAVALERRALLLTVSHDVLSCFDSLQLATYLQRAFRIGLSTKKTVQAIDRLWREKRQEVGSAAARSVFRSV